MRQYPIVSIEDGLAEGDWDGWKMLTAALGDRVQLVGDDVFVTNPEILKRGIADGVGNALLVKLNQIGTVTETLDAVRDGARRAATRRSSRTARAKPRTRRSPTSRSAPPPARSRPARRAAPIASCKYNQLLRIEEELGAPARYRRRGRPSARSAGRDAWRLRCISSFCCATARAPGTRRTGSPAGPTSTCPSEGATEAREAGRLLQEGGYVFDLAFTSVLKRAIRTLWIALDELDQLWIPVTKNWRLNERHYGALQGLNKAETAAKHGEAQVKIWRRSYDIPPPPLDAGRPTASRRTIRATRRSTPDELPLTESLKDTVARFLPYWHETIAPAIQSRQARAHRRARQQPARAGEVSRRRLRTRTSSS